MTAARQSQFILLILILAAIVRLSGLGSFPPPLQWDEASRAYDAWSLLQTGADRHGRSYPLFLESFGEGDWTAALTTWLTVPFVGLLGPGAWAVRLPDAMLGVLTVAALYVFLLRMIGPAPALIGAAILALDPWHIGLCRTGHEAGYAPFFLIMAMLGMQQCGLLTSSAEPDQPPVRVTNAWAAIAGLMFGLHAWVYPATRLFTPILLMAMILAFRREWRARLQQVRDSLIAFCLGVAVGSAPLWITALTHPERLAARSRVTVFAADGLSFGSRATEFIQNYAANFSPNYQFARADEMSGMTLYGVGLHLLVTAPLALCGLYVLVRRCRKSPWHMFLIAWLILYPIPAAICRDWNPHPFRTVSGILLFPILCAVGWQWLIDCTSTWPVQRRNRAAGLAAFALATNAAWFCHVYFIRMPEQLERGYQTALVRAMQFVGRADNVDFVLVTRWFNQPYIYALLYAPIPPEDLPDLPLLQGHDLLGFHQVNRIGKFFFPPREPEKTPELTAAFQQAFNMLPPDAEGLVIEVAGRFGGGDVLATFSNGREPQNGPPLEVRRWRRSEDPSPRTPNPPLN